MFDQINQIMSGPNDNLTIDSERLKYISGTIKRTIVDLKNAKKNADCAWEQCETSLGKQMTNDIRERKVMINKKFESAIVELEHEADKLDSISNIWNETEEEIMTSSKSLDGILSDLNKALSSFFGTGKKQ